MSAEQKRAERLAAERIPLDDWDHWNQEPVDTYGYPETERKGFIAGYLASKRLSESEWAEKREQVARAIFARQFPGSSTTMDPLESLEANAPYYYADADAAMIALGFTRTSEPGGDT